MGRSALPRRCARRTVRDGPPSTRGTDHEGYEDHRTGFARSHKLRSPTPRQWQQRRRLPVLAGLRRRDTGSHRVHERQLGRTVEIQFDINHGHLYPAPYRLYRPTERCEIGDGQAFPDTQATVIGFQDPEQALLRIHDRGEPTAVALGHELCDMAAIARRFGFRLFECGDSGRRGLGCVHLTQNTPITNDQNPLDPNKGLWDPGPLDVTSSPPALAWRCGRVIMPRAIQHEVITMTTRPAITTTQYRGDLSTHARPEGEQKKGPV